MSATGPVPAPSPALVSPAANSSSNLLPTPRDAAVILEELWSSTLDEFRRALTPNQLWMLQRVKTVEHLTAELTIRDTTYKKRRVPRLLARLDPLIQNLQFFSAAVNIFVQSNPEVAALIWGSVFTLLELTVRHRQHLDHIADFLDHVGKHLPRIKSFADLLVLSSRIETAICSLYRVLIQFFLQAAVFLEKNPAANLLCLSLPCRKESKFRDQFSHILQVVQQSTQWIDVEANIALHRHTCELTSRGHQEILKSLSIMASSPATAAPSSATHRLLPHLANPSFFGRSDELKHLEAALIPKKQGKLHVFSIIGEGGVGKSQLALQFAYNHLDDFPAVFWVSADTPVKLAQGYQNIAAEIGLVQIFRDQTSLPAVRETTKKWFRDTDSTWLLVLDNVESSSSLDDYWPQGACGAVLLTTRNQTLTQPPVSAAMTLKCFTAEEGAQFLIKNILQIDKGASDEDSKAATQVSVACGGLPLALSQVVRHIQTLHLSIADAKRDFTTPESFVTVHGALEALEQADYYHQAGVATCWDSSLRSLSAPGLNLARIIAHFDPDGIPGEFLKSRSEGGFPKSTGSVNVINGQLISLLSSSLISRGLKSNVFTMHRLIQTTILQRLDTTQKADFFRMVLSVVDEFFPAYSSNDRLTHAWLECGRTLPHVQRLLELFSSSRATHSLAVHLKLGKLLERASWYLQERGSLSDAQYLLEAATDIAQTGLRLTLEGNQAVSKTRYELSSTDIEDLKGGFELLLSDTTNSLGALHLELGQFDNALEQFFLALEMRRKTAQPDLEMIYMQKNIGIAYLSSNRVEEAYSAFTESLNRMETWLATAEHAERYRDSLASSFGSLSAALTVMHRLDEAWDAAMKSTELCKQVHAPESVILSNCYTTLGRIRRLQGSFDDAEGFCLKALDIRGKRYGQHEATALALHNYARIIACKGDLTEAIKIQTQAVEMLRGLPGSGRALARASFYLNGYLRENDGTFDATAEQEAYKLYVKQVGSKAKLKKDLVKEDFDNLLVHSAR